MKKLMTTMLAAGIMFAVAGQAKAAALETSGEFRARGWYLDNYFANKESSDIFDQRLRLMAKWPISETAGVAFRADILEGFWGEATKGVAPDGTSFETSSKQAQIAFDQVYGWVAVPNTPVTLTLGRQEVNWGTGFFAQADNRDRFKALAKIAPVTIGFMYDKNAEVEPTVQHQLDTGKVNDNAGWTLAVLGSAADIKYGALVGYGLNKTDATKEQTRISGDVYVMGKGGPVDYKAEFVYQAGKNDNYDAAKQDVDIAAYAAYLGISMPAGPLTVAVDAAYLSGDDRNTKDKNEGSIQQDYQGPFNSVLLFNNMDYDGVVALHDGDANTGYGKDTSFGNAWVAKVSATGKVGPVTLTGAFVTGAALEEKGAVDAAGAPVMVATGNKNEDGTNEMAQKVVPAESFGYEIDLIAAYQIAQNIDFTLGVGYLLAGDFFGDMDNPLGVMGGFKFKF